MCASAGARGAGAHLGRQSGHAGEFFAESKLIVIRAATRLPATCISGAMCKRPSATARGWCCIDPRRTETADKCHVHIALRPGTDAALALSLMHELDPQRLATTTPTSPNTPWVGTALRARALEWPPERAAEVCGIGVQEVIDLARDYGRTARAGEPVAIRLNYGMQRVRGGGNAVRADCLPACTGRRVAPPCRRLCCCRRRAVAPVNNALRCSGPICWRVARRAAST